MSNLFLKVLVAILPNGQPLQQKRSFVREHYLSEAPENQHNFINLSFSFSRKLEAIPLKKNL